MSTIMSNSLLTVKQGMKSILTNSSYRNNSSYGKVLLLSNAYNGLTQKVHCHLKDKGINPSVELAINSDQISKVVREHKPDLILCPFLTKKIPRGVWENYKCVVIHPGVKGDRGPSSLDWAILRGEREWGVTLLSAVDGMDEGPVWASRNFPLLPGKSKTLTYSDEVSQTALACVDELLVNLKNSNFSPEIVQFDSPHIKGKLRPNMKQAERAINFQSDSTHDICRKVNASCSQPGAKAELIGEEYFLYDCYEESTLKGNPGEILAQRDQAICIGTRDGAVWITHLKKKGPKEAKYIKLPATSVLSNDIINIPFKRISLNSQQQNTYRQIQYHKEGKIGFLSFNFLNGAMNSYQCEKLIESYGFASRQTDTEVIVISGGPQSFSNGINLNTIEDNEFPNTEAYKNLYLINYFIKEVLNTKTHLTVSYMGNSAGAGGVPMALAADLVYARDGVILNPHYRNMGLYGSELWTYSLPKRVGFATAQRLTRDCLPLNAHQATDIGLVDATFPTALDMKEQVKKIVVDNQHKQLLKRGNETRIKDEEQRPLQYYERHEMNTMYKNIFENNWGFKEKRKEFVYKSNPTATPEFLLKSNASDPAPIRLRSRLSSDFSQTGVN